MLTFELSGGKSTRVQAMNILTQVEVDRSTHKVDLYTYSVNFTQPPFTVSLQGGVQWLVMVCSE